jgi:hypothetical protein
LTARDAWTAALLVATFAPAIVHPQLTARARVLGTHMHDVTGFSTPKRLYRPILGGLPLLSERTWPARQARRGADSGRTEACIHCDSGSS